MVIATENLLSYEEDQIDGQRSSKMFLGETTKSGYFTKHLGWKWAGR